MAGVNLPILDDQVIRRFLAKVNKTETCWFWSGAMFQNGYGEARVNGRKFGAHRISWLIHRGAIPAGLCVLHDCPNGDNRACVNPEHLWLGTKGQNNTDAGQKGRMLTGKQWRQAHMSSVLAMSGEGHHNHIRCKSIYARRDEINSLYSSGWSQQSIADYLGVSQTLISKIIRGLV